MKTAPAQRSQPPAERVIHAVQASSAPTSETLGFKRESYYGELADREAVAAIRAKFGLSSNSDAVRLALRLAASDAIKWQLAPAPARRITVKFSRR